MDGVLTDGRIYMDDSGERFKASRRWTAHGLKSLQACGIEPIVITGRDSPACAAAWRTSVQARGLWRADKLAVAGPPLSSLGLAWARSAPWVTTGLIAC